MDMLQNPSDFAGHLIADLFVISFGKFPAFVFEVEVLDVGEKDLLLADQKVPFRLFDDGGFQCVFLAEERNADRSDDAASQQSAEQVGHQSSGVNFLSSSSISRS